MFTNIPTVPLYPFLSNNDHLIESFLIIGFSKETIREYLITKKQTISSPIEILSSISNAKKPSTHFNRLTKYVFPSAPEVCTEKFLPRNKERSKFIFFFQEFNPNFNEQKRNNKSGSYAGFVFAFHEEYCDAADKTVFAPKAFCVITRNACFGFCNKLCELVYEKYRSGVEAIPMEVIVYNVVHFVPAAVNCNINVDLEQLMTWKHETSITRSTVSTAYSDDGNRRTGMDSKYKYFIEQLSGYPQFHFCICDVLKVLSYKNLIEISLYMLFEFNVFYFSRNLEVLNNVMYVCTFLNWPLTDSLLMGQIVIISEDSFAQQVLPFAKSMNFILGVNAAFENCKESIQEGNYEKYIIVDIDNREIVNSVQFTNKMKSVIDVDVPIDEDIKQITEIITRLVNKKKISSPGIETPVHRWVTSMHEFVKKNAIKDSSPSHWGELFSYEMNEDVKKMNMELQGIFFIGILSFIKFFYQFYRTVISDSNNVHKGSGDVVMVQEVENVKMSKEEKIILSTFKGTMNSDSYIKFFLKQRLNIDNYQIPFLFTDELIQMKHLMEPSSPIMKTPSFGRCCLSIIDQIYASDNTIHTHEIDFSEFISFYQKEQLKDTFLPFLTDSAFYKRKHRGDNVFLGDHIEFDTDILFKYSYILSNADSLVKIFPSLTILHNNDIKHISPRIVESHIEHTFIHSLPIKTKDIILTVYFDLLVCIADKVDLPCQLNALASCVPVYDMGVRKVLNVMMAVYVNIAQKKKSEVHKRNMEIEQVDKLINHFIGNGCLPNSVFISMVETLVEDKKKENEGYEYKGTVLKKEKTSVDNKDIQFEVYCTDATVKKREIRNFIAKTLEHGGYSDVDLALPSKSGKAHDNKAIMVELAIQKSSEKVQMNLYSPIKLYKKAKMVTNDYINNGKRELIKNDKFKKLISVLLFYMHTIEELKKLSFEPFIKYLKSSDK